MLKIENANYKYNTLSENSDINNINIHVNNGECVLLCGRSGSGKTTISKLINSLIPNYYETGELSGRVLVDGVDTLKSQIYEVSRVVSSVFQNPKTQFFNVNTTSEILFYLENRGFDREYMKNKLAETAEIFDIEYLFNRDIFELSGGEKQIIAIAAAYASGTQIILLDEPSSNLDQKRTILIGKILSKLKQLGRTIIISEHRFYYIKDIIDRVYYIDNGKVIDEFNGTEFFNISDEKRRKLGLRSINFEKLNLIDGNFSDDLDNSDNNIQCVKNNINNSNNTNEDNIDEKDFINTKKHDNLQKSNKLTINNLAYRFNGQNRSLQMSNEVFNLGSIVGIYGHNGVGKSTFIKILMGLIKTRNVSIKLENKNLSNKTRLKLSYLVMQDVNHQLFTDSVYTEVSLGMSDKYSKNDIDRVLNVLNIYEFKDKHPMSLSGGQKQRVAIASAILSGAKIICFDEPTSGMDYDNMMRISKLIKDTINDDIIIFIISHDHEFLNNTADKILDISRYSVKGNSNFK